MKIISLHLCIALIFLAGRHQVLAQGTAFTYQGQLQNNGSPVNGLYDLQFILFTNAQFGFPAAPILTNASVAVTNGLFTTELDFGSAIFTGTNEWLDISVRPNGNGTFTELSPRQPLTPTPNAIYAENASGLSSSLSAAQLTSIGNTGVGASGNFFVGPAGNSTTTGYDNTADGYNALPVNMDGYENTAFGFQTLYLNTNGYQNTAIGFQSLYYNTGGFYNTGEGFRALYANTAGYYNTAMGASALSSNTNGDYNTAVGVSALYANKNGSYNTAIGDYSLFENNTGGGNTAEGNSALYGNTSGNNNTANGSKALSGNLTGNNNTANGFEALYENLTGNNNTANGAEALISNTNGLNNTADGMGALVYNANGNGNTAVGVYALSNNVSGYNNTAAGLNALPSGTNDIDNVSIGVGSFQIADSATANTAVGTYSFQQFTTGNNNIGIGYQAGIFCFKGTNNIYIGNNGTSENGIIRIGAQGTQTATYLAGTVYADGGSVELSSDRNIKEGFTPVNPQEVLAKVTALPVTQWNYKSTKGVEHIGPMAQDFQAAFRLNGQDDRHISVVDEDGVALAAIQGLNQKLNAKDAEIQDLKQSVAELKQMVQALAARK